MYDIIIIGAGPAGLTAAIYASRAGKKVLVIEKSNYGGQIINANNIENYPGKPNVSGYEFANDLYRQAKDLGVNIIFEEVISVIDGSKKKIKTSKNEYESLSIIIATGLSKKKLDLPNKDELIGKGISYCATCDGNFYKDKVVAVVGGGNTALEDAIYLSDIAKKVYLIHRHDSFRADKIIVDKLNSNVEVLYNSVITKINGSDFLESIEINNDKEIKVNGLFIAIGETPKNDIFNDLLKTDDKGYIIAKEDCHTNISGIFVAGDIRTKELRQLVTAVSDGATSAYEAVKYINNL